MAAFYESPFPAVGNGEGRQNLTKTGGNLKVFMVTFAEKASSSLLFCPQPARHWNDRQVSLKD